MNAIVRILFSGVRRYHLTPLNVVFIFICGVLYSASLSAQDTFLEKKKSPPPQVATSAVTDSSWQHDSIISYTLEYPGEGGIWVVVNLKGPHIVPPMNAPRNTRILCRNIVAIDDSGRRYRVPDQYLVAGMFFPVK